MSYFDDLLNEALPSEFDSGENTGGSDMYEGANMDMKKEFKSAMTAYKSYMNSAKTKFRPQLISIGFSKKMRSVSVSDTRLKY